MTTTRMKEQLNDWGRAKVAAKLSAHAYKNEKDAVAACKEMGFPWAKLISRDGAECLVAKDRNDLWFAFRGTEPSKLNDVMADLKVFRNAAIAGGKVHSGFQQEVNDLWMDILKELEHNEFINNLQNKKLEIKIDKEKKNVLNSKFKRENINNNLSIKELIEVQNFEKKISELNKELNE